MKRYPGIFGMLACIATLLLCNYLYGEERPKQSAHIFDAVVVRVYDGDTVYVVPKSMIVKVRMLDCWAPEIRGGTIESKQKGFNSRDHLSDKIPEGSTVRVKIPLFKTLDKSFTFGRPLGRIWSEDGIDLSEFQVSNNHATKEKD